MIFCFWENSIVCEIYEDSKLTYGDLKKYSDALAKYIISECKEDKSPIIIYSHKDYEMIISFLACSKSGHAYIAIDTTFIKDRIKDIVESSKQKPFINIGNIDKEQFKKILINLGKKIVKYLDISIVLYYKCRYLISFD